MGDNIATDVGETLTALHRILGIGGCDNAKVIEWFQYDESSSFDYFSIDLVLTTLILTLRASNDESKNEYNDISQWFIVF